MTKLAMIRVVGTERQLTEIKAFIAKVNRESTESVAAIYARDWTPFDAERELSELVQKWEDEAAAEEADSD